MSATVTRLHMRDRVKIGQAWQRKADGTVWTIRQIHRADRQVQILPDYLTGPLAAGVVHLVSFKDLRRRFRQVGP